MTARRSITRTCHLSPYLFINSLLHDLSMSSFPQVFHHLSIWLAHDQENLDCLFFRMIQNIVIGHDIGNKFLWKWVYNKGMMSNHLKCVWFFFSCGRPKLRAQNLRSFRPLYKRVRRRIPFFLLQFYFFCSHRR